MRDQRKTRNALTSLHSLHKIPLHSLSCFSSAQRPSYFIGSLLVEVHANDGLSSYGQISHSTDRTPAQREKEQDKKLQVQGFLTPQ